MSIVIGEVTAGGGQQRPKLPTQIERLFAAADVKVPSQGKIPIYDVDRALKGIDDVGERLYIKSLLREKGYVA